jgi:hypothetical protein
MHGMGGELRKYCTALALVLARTRRRRVGMGAFMVGKWRLFVLEESKVVLSSRREAHIDTELKYFRILLKCNNLGIREVPLSPNHRSRVCLLI